jgi:hypothetical protein
MAGGCQMGLSGFLDVAIGLMFMYLVLSLICTTINELIATFLKVRSKNLAATMRALIDDPKVFAAFYNHGLIANSASASSGGVKPETETRTTAPAAGSPPDAAPETLDVSKPPADSDHPSYFDPKVVALALLDSLDPKHRQSPKSELTFPSFQEIEQTIGELPDSDIRDVLMASLAAANNDVGKLRDNVAGWFDSAMERLSGEYKRGAKKLALIVGVVVALVLNADSIDVGKLLWKDETLRAQIVSTASETLKNDRAVAAAHCDSTQTPDVQATCLLGELDKETETLRPFPIGWTLKDLPGWDCDKIWRSIGNAFLWFLVKGGGVLWTGLALSLGAPFWFDLLQKFMNLRGTGGKPGEKDDKK